MTLLATIIIPTHDNGPTIRYALTSVLRQTVRDFEVIIVGDGVADGDKPLLAELARSDARVRFVDREKHERRGEPYRHEALREARGRIVCYLCDRDLWLPCHLERMQQQLQSADFTHSLSLHVLPDGGYQFFPADLALAEHRQFMLNVANRVPLSCAAHTLEAYRALDTGWHTTPQGIATDWYMFRRFLQMDGCRVSSGTYPSALTFPSGQRKGWSREKRVAELRAWSERLDDATARAELVLEILQQSTRARDAKLAELIRNHSSLSRRLDEIRHSPTWRFRQAVVRIPGLRSLVRTVFKR